jgi:Acyl-CoA carboxylase epsilon subunit
MTSSQAQSPGGPGPLVAENETPGAEATGAEAPGPEATGAKAIEAAPRAAAAIVVHGGATPEQLAALVAVLSAASGGDAPASDGSTSTWAAHSAAMRHPVNHGPGAWRTSLRS